MATDSSLFFVMSLPPRSIAEARWGAPEDVEREAQKRMDEVLFETLQPFWP